MSNSGPDKAAQARVVHKKKQFEEKFANRPPLDLSVIANEIISIKMDLYKLGKEASAQEVKIGIKARRKDTAQDILKYEADVYQKAFISQVNALLEPLKMTVDDLLKDKKAGSILVKSQRFLDHAIDTKMDYAIAIKDKKAADLAKQSKVDKAIYEQKNVLIAEIDKKLKAEEQALKTAAKAAREQKTAELPRSLEPLKSTALAQSKKPGERIVTALNLSKTAREGISKQQVVPTETKDKKKTPGF